MGSFASLHLIGRSKGNITKRLDPVASRNLPAVMIPKIEMGKHNRDRLTVQKKVFMIYGRLILNLSQYS